MKRKAYGGIDRQTEAHGAKENIERQREAYAARGKQQVA